MESDDLARPVIIVTSFLTKQVEYEIYTFGEQTIVMPLSGEWAKVQSKGKNMVSEYAKQTINQKLQKLLPCDYLLRVKWSSLDLYIPEYYKWRIIGKAGATINDLEKTIWLSINVKSFADLPLLDVQTQMSTAQKNSRVDIAFPAGYEDKEIVVIIGDDLLRTRTDTHASLVIKDKNMVKQIQKKGYLLVDAEKL